MKNIKRALALVLCTAMLLGLFAVAIPFTASAVYDNSNTYTVTGVDVKLPNAVHGGIYVFTNNTSSNKILLCADYLFENSKFLVFDGNGKLQEAGQGICSYASAPQIDLVIPANGFAVAFGDNAASSLNTCYLTALEGAHIDRETVHVVYDVKGTFNKSQNNVTIEYNNPKAVSADTKKFLFVGNSGTYTNGNPLKFKGLAAAAGIDVDVTYCTVGGAYLYQFADESDTTRGSLIRSKLNEKQYDYVVFQDHGGADYTKSKQGLDVLIPLVEDNGATPVLYMRNAYDQDIEARELKAYGHYSNFMQLKRTYGIEMVAPVADAHMYCSRTYPEIDLFCNDKAHQSVEGSYLFACVCAITYLGIDVRGNTYTAGIPADTARKLQECATIACSEGYRYPQNSYSENGKYYENIAKFKPYSTDATPYQPGKDYSDAAEGSTKPLGKLTDSACATNGGETAIGAYVGRTVDIVVDLKGTHVIKAVRTDVFGGTWGISDPSYHEVTVSVSNDGTNWSSIGKATQSEEITNANWKKRLFNLTVSGEETKAKYVKLTYNTTAEGANSYYAWTSDIQVFGYETEDVENTNNSITLNKPYKANGIHTHEDGTMPYPDENSTSLTNGIYAPSDASYKHEAYAAFHRTSAFYQTNGFVSIIVDLGKVYDIDSFKAFVGSSLNISAGIVAPKTVSVYVSNDNENWKSVGNASLTDSTTVSQITATLELDNAVTGKYIQYRFECQDDKNWIMVSEVEAYGSEHSHNYGNSWKTDATGHWHECSCGEKADLNSHDSGKWHTTKEAEVGVSGEKELRCTVCDFILDTDTIPELKDPTEPPVDDPVTPPADDPVTPPADDPVTPPADDPVTPPADDPVDPPKDEDPVEPPKDEEPDDGDYMLGDINESGEIDSMDYILLKRNYFGTYKFTEKQLKIGDITKNGEIDSMDYILLKRAYFGTYEIK